MHLIFESLVVETVGQGNEAVEPVREAFVEVTVLAPAAGPR